MPQPITLQVNGHTHYLHVEPQTPLLYALRNELGLKVAKITCDLAQCSYTVRAAL
jgi:aerobic-type carbon monoxide dehydrogenase small subunit (CoxS/CutS family)